MIAPALFAALSMLVADEKFDAFKDSFRSEAIAAGIDGTLYDREMASAELLEVVFERNDNQPEFVKPIWEYLEDIAMSDQRVEQGRARFAQHQDMLAMTEASYGVDPAIIVAIWGLETYYGRITGGNDILSALATLGHEGRRQSFGRTQLIAALTILQEGHAARRELRGSWAGAMGQTQFIPTTYLAYAVDQNGDGRKDLWSDLGDVFASTANYLDQSGWQTGEPVVAEVRLPEDFDFAMADGRRLRVSDWTELGLTGMRGPLEGITDPAKPAKLLLPAGAAGPAFLTFRNFDAVKRYNNAVSYALGITLLAEMIKGEDEVILGDWPRSDRPLTRSERMALQERLNAQGYNAGTPDGIIGPNTRRAIRDWQRAEGLPADGYASAAVLNRLMES